MKVDIPAYEIGGVFLLMALFMYGTSVSGFFPKVFGHGKTVAIVIAVVALAVLAIRYGPQAFEQARSAWIGEPEAAPAVPSPAPVAPKRRVAHAAKAVTPIPMPQSSVVEDEPPRIITEPAHPNAPADANPYDSRLKHAAKSVGRFLHVVPKHDP
jgi:hypothetical protein